MLLSYHLVKRPDMRKNALEEGDVIQMSRLSNFRSTTLNQAFIMQYLPAAQSTGTVFEINPAVILAQSTIETGWGESCLARERHRSDTLALHQSDWGTKHPPHSHYSCLIDSYRSYRLSVQTVHCMSWNENYCRIIRHNRATGFAIYHCLLQSYWMHPSHPGISGSGIIRISTLLLVSERWVHHVLCKPGTGCVL